MGLSVELHVQKQEWRKLMNIFNYFQTISTHSLIFQKVHILEERSVKIKTKQKRNEIVFIVIQTI